jgi:glucose-6-phosphate 1-dehydrogenase
MGRLRKPPMTNMLGGEVHQNYVRFRLSPEMTVALAVSASTPVGESRETVELIASRHPCPEEMEAYERVLTDAMAGDATLFARQDYVEEAWRIVDPVLKAATPVYPYDPHTWGPKEVEQTVVPPGGWEIPVAQEPEDFRVVVRQPTPAASTV